MISPEAQMILRWANQEAVRLYGSYLDTHCLLLALAVFPSTHSCAYLKGLGLSYTKIRYECDRIQPAAPEMVMISRIPPTPRVQQILDRALANAETLGVTLDSEFLLESALQDDYMNGLLRQWLTNTHVGIVQKQL